MPDMPVTLNLPGVHNVENYMAAFAAVDGVVSPEMCRAVARTYGGVTHRLELIRKLNGVSYINDSIATSPTRTIAGLRAMRASAEREVALIESSLSVLLRRQDAGSRAKASELAPELARRLDDVRQAFVASALTRLIP